MDPQYGAPFPSNGLPMDHWHNSSQLSAPAAAALQELIAQASRTSAFDYVPPAAPRHPLEYVHHQAPPPPQQQQQPSAHDLMHQLLVQAGLAPALGLGLGPQVVPPPPQPAAVYVLPPSEPPMAPLTLPAPTNNTRGGGRPAKSVSDGGRATTNNSYASRHQQVSKTIIIYLHSLSTLPPLIIIVIIISFSSSILHRQAEARRRSRINERLEALRTVVPHSDRANTVTFLEEAVGYVQRLQTRVLELEMKMGLPLTVPAAAPVPITFGDTPTNDNANNTNNNNNNTMTTMNTTNMNTTATNSAATNIHLQQFTALHAQALEAMMQHAAAAPHTVNGGGAAAAAFGGVTAGLQSMPSVSEELALAAHLGQPKGGGGGGGGSTDCGGCVTQQGTMGESEPMSPPPHHVDNGIKVESVNGDVGVEPATKRQRSSK